jgi:hypothetical protein
MLNPMLSELIAHEQDKDRFRQAEQHRLVKAAIARQSADRSDLHIPLGDRWIAMRHLFKALACRLGAIGHW